jgi:hypothetical protein
MMQALALTRSTVGTVRHWFERIGRGVANAWLRLVVRVSKIRHPFDYLWFAIGAVALALFLLVLWTESVHRR